MSDRKVAVGKDDRTQRWIRTVEDRLNQLETRRLQGAQSMGVASIEQVSVGATRDLPVRLNGPTLAGQWTEQIEQFGTAHNTDDPNYNYAKTIRDSNGKVQDITPRPWFQWLGGSAIAVATGTTSVLGPANITASFAAPFDFSDVYDATNGHIIIPMDGVWDLTLFGQWAPVNDSTVRVIFFQLSSNGGANFANFFTAYHAAVLNATDSQQFGLNYPSAMLKGWRLRICAFHRSATTPINFTLVRASIGWRRAN